jgi:hypothetical protein
MGPVASTAQSKKKTTKKGKIEIKKEAFMKLTDDEKNDLVSQEIELVQAEIDQVCVHQHQTCFCGAVRDVCHVDTISDSMC